MDRAVADHQDPRYARFAHQEWKATQDYLYDREEHLFYRDSRFFERRDSKGRKLFWSRGIGWVFAGVARVLTFLPKDDPARPAYQALFKEMAAEAANVAEAGRLLANLHYSHRKTRRPNRAVRAFSSTASRGGINAGLLDRATYEPSVLRGWRALEKGGGCGRAGSAGYNR